MPRGKATALTDREAQIMEILWQEGPTTADVIRARLPGEPHDSTVRTLLRVMEQKGLVAHTLEQRAYVYHALIQQAKAQRTAIQGLIRRLFGGSAKKLVLQLLDDEEITPAELQRLAEAAPPPPKPSRKRGSP
ncbi:MAG: BlaI/MecI/CopY family transcriptional regulator [Planctomycetes bacterium]|nr:BlaI/MecI/CopY family transcriptional regulator [Planctomycetota bacterium]